jgi:hypothetical protein
MKNPLIPAFALALCLIAAGCTDANWNHLLNYGGAEEEPVAPPAQAAAAPAPAATAEPAHADFCRNVASQDATRNDFDQATQQRVFARSYAQCVAIYTR